MELKQYLQPLIKWWWLIAAATAVATAASLLAVARQPAIYRTSTAVAVGSAMDRANPTASELVLTQELANTYADIANRNVVRKGVMNALGLTWLPDYTVRIVPETQLLELSVTDSDPLRAQAVANELASQLIEVSPASASKQDAARQEFINNELHDLETTITQTKAQIADKQNELTQMFSARQIADTQTQIAGLQNKLLAVQANYAAMLSNSQQGATNRIQVIEPAELPTIPIGPNRMMTVLLAAIIGFLLAAAAAHLLEYLDDTIKNPDDVSNAFGLNTLSAVPAFDQIEETQDEVPLLTSDRSAPTEAFRVLRTNLQFTAVENPLKTLVISSPSPSEGKSLTIANLAVSLAKGERRVLLVDTDLHRPRLHRLFKLKNNVGVTSALLEEHPSIDSLLQPTSLPGLQVLTSGPLPPNSAELLGSARMRALLEDLASRADIVLLDSPPVTVLADAAILSSQCDGVLLVLDSGRTRREPARRALQALRRVDARVVGVVLNRMPMRGAGYYYYYDYYRYYSSGDENNGSSPRSGPPAPAWAAFMKRFDRRSAPRRRSRRPAETP